MTSSETDKLIHETYIETGLPRHTESLALHPQDIVKSKQEHEVHWPN